MDQANLLRISTFTYIYRIPYTIISCLTLGETSHLGGYCASLLWLPLVGWKIVARTNQTENVSSWCVIRAGNQTHFHVSLSICSTAPESSWNLKNLIFSSQSSFLKKAISQLKLFKCYSIYLHRGHWLSIEGREKVVSGYLHLWSSMIGWFNVQHIICNQITWIYITKVGSMECRRLATIVTIPPMCQNCNRTTASPKSCHRSCTPLV